MASIIRHGSGWRALVKKAGQRKSKVFKSKTEARDWALRIESELDSGGAVDQKRLTRAILERYRDNESPRKRSYKWEWKKIDHLITMIGDIPVASLTQPRMSEWRDSRMREVTNATVNREWNLLNVIFNKAVKEWHWLSQNPLEGLQRPTNPPPRERLITAQEIALIEHTTGFKDCPDTLGSRVGAAFLFAIETAMRAGEIVGLKPDCVDLDKRVCHLPLTKNGSSRVVPLSTRAVEILMLVECDFNLTSRQLDSNFRKYRRLSGIENLHFHDTRHQAITNLAKKVDVLDLARIVGMRDLKTLMVYYNESAESIAQKLG